MRTPEEQLTELHRRMDVIRQKRIRRARILSVSAVAVCFVLAVLFAAAVARAPIQASGTMSAGATASIFADHAALGFVAVAVIAFCLGAMVTVLCDRLRNAAEGGDKRDDRQH